MIHLLRKYAFFTILFISISLVWGQSGSPRHLETIAKAGDGVYALLDRYGIRNDCNLNYFYQINSLRQGQYLKVGQSYRLPIVRYTYNGRSIRSTTGVEDFDWALGIQHFNEYMSQRGLRQTDFRDDRDLWVPYSSLYCREEKLPIQTLYADNSGESNALLTSNAEGVSGDIRGIYKIFGPKHERVPLVSTALSGKVFFLVSGHGGADPGAVGKRGRYQLCEDEYAYDVTLRLARQLTAYGATVYMMTRDPDDGIRSDVYLPCDTDETCWGDVPIPAGQSDRLWQRSDAVNTLYRTNQARGVVHQRMVVIHVDSDNKYESVDLYFYHRQDDPVSQQMALQLRNTMERKYREHQAGRVYEGSVSTRDLHMLRETEAPGVFIELGNIQNQRDQDRIVIERNRQLLAEWLFEGLLLEAQ